ncbi:DMT family transporter [bacterium]|nr:DMT family transporter [bacterium]
MFVIGFAILFGLIAGSAVALQGPMISLIGQRMGTLESVFIIHLSGAVLSGIPLVVLRGGSLSTWRTLPWYVFFAGGFGMIIVATISFGLPRIGAAAIFTIMIIAQLITAVTLDHFGWLQPTVRSLDLTRIAGIGIIMFGTWMVVRT